MPGPRVSVTSTRAMVAAAERRGVDTGVLLTQHDVSPVVLEDPDARLDATIVHALWTDLTERSREPLLPVYAALELPWGAYRVIDYLCGHATTMGEAAELLTQHFGLVNDAVVLALRPSSDGTTMRMERGDGGQIPTRYVDYALTACVSRLSRAVGSELHGTVRLRREAPGDLGAHIQAFGPDLHFGQAADEVHFDAALWATPSRAPDPGLRSVLASHAQLLLAQLDVQPSLLQQLRQEVEQGLPFGRTELSRVARRLDTSARTLQRRLAEEGLTWREFVDPIRDELAFAYLRDRSLSIEEVACMVGYSDATSFHRAFSRKTGQTPGAWRSTH